MDCRSEFAASQYLAARARATTVHYRIAQPVPTRPTLYQRLIRFIAGH